jgi:hypothetical protein
MRRAAALLVLAGATACSGAGTKLDAAEDVRAFITAVRAGDEATFEKHIDRPALRRQVLVQIQAALGGGEGPLAEALGGGLAERAADELLRPESFRLALERAGAPARTPTAPEIATQLREVENGRVCLPSAPEGPCAVTFAKQGEVWRLVAINAGDLQAGTR